MNAKNPALPRSLTSDLARIDAHVVSVAEYDDLPEAAFYLVGSIEEAMEKARELNPIDDEF